MSTDKEIATVIAAAIGLLGTVVGFVGAMIVARFTYRQKDDEVLFKAFDFLGGGSQQRNLGIAAIELFWPKTRHRPILVSLLIGSAVYLLRESKQKDAAHEIHNLDRIMKLLLTPEAFSAGQRTQYESLSSALENAAPLGKETPPQTPVLAEKTSPDVQTTGLWIPAMTLKNWRQNLGSLLGENSTEA